MSDNRNSKSQRNSKSKNLKPVISQSTKLVTREQAVAHVLAARANKARIGFTSGAFDLLHIGHVQYLEKAKALCDVLIVGVNSDASVRSYKDPRRPFNFETDRAQVLCGLASVDLVFLFEEKNNNQNILDLKPDIYIKAGDYKKEQLSSAPLVESYGGSIEIIPFVEGRSSSNIIQRIVESENIRSIDAKPAAPRATVFFDRDGTLIEHVEYLSEPSKVKLLDGAVEGMKLLQENGFALVVVTNQPGIGLGYFSKEDFFAVNREFFKQVSAHGVRIDKVYFCPHSMSEQCECRKPGTALLDRAFDELPADRSKSFFFGDMSSDIECGKRASLRTILVGSGRAGKDGLFSAKPDSSVTSILEGAKWILSQVKT